MKMQMARSVILALGLAALSSPAWATLPQVANVRVLNTGVVTWDGLPGAAGYNIYNGDVAGLRSGNYGGCLVGSVQGASAQTPADAIPLGTAVFFLVDGFDESGEGPVADPPGASPSLRCVPARRNFMLTPEGDPGDGIADGTEPLRNPSVDATGSGKGGSITINLSTGELALSTVDLDFLVPCHGQTGGGISARGGGAGKGGKIQLGSQSSTADLLTGGGLSANGAGTGKGGSIQIGDGTSTVDLLAGGAGGGALGANGAGTGEGGVIVLDGGSGRRKPGGIDLYYTPNGDTPKFPPDCSTCHNGFSSPASASLAAASQAARSYRSQVHYAGPLGQGWDFPANARLAPSGNQALYFDGTGRQELFVRLDASHFAPVAGRYALLFQNADGSFTLRNRDGALQNFHAFDGSNRQGTLESVQSRQGDRATFLYESQGLLVDMVDSLGRAVHYSYNADGRIASITDFAGRQVVYSYDSDGNLASARSPIVTGTPNGNDFPNGRTESYGYSSGFADERLNGNLILVMRPNEFGSGVPSIQVSYGSDVAAFNFDRVVSQTIGGTNASGIAAGGTLTLSYQSLNPGADPSNLTLPRRQATLFDRNGNRTDFVHNAAGNCLSRTDFTNRNLRSGEPDYTTQFSYNSDGELIEVDSHSRVKVQFFWDRPGSDRYREGNLIMVRSIADTLAGGGRGDGHGGESQDIVRTFTYEPIYNQIASTVDPRGNDPTYVPQTGGANSPARYTRTWTYDYQEADPALNGINAYAGRFGISLTGGQFALGDVNGDGITTQTGGNPVKVGDPNIHLDPTSMQAAIAGGPLQIIETKIEWNGHGQPTAITDAEGNRHEFQYYPETDPDGDGVVSPPPLDHRSLDPATGGFLESHLVDTLASPGRDNGVNPGPIQIRRDFKYDPMGNLASLIDGRGVATRFIHNALGELVEMRRAAATADGSGPDGTPPTGRGETGLTPFGFLARYFYDANGNLVTRQREDRGGTRGVGPFLTTSLTYDILDDLVQASRSASAAATLTTQYRYDANQNLVHLVEPDGNSHDRAFDERDLLLSSTRGAAGPFGGSPSVRRYDYDGDGNLARLVDGRDGIVDYLYDGHDRLARSVDPVGGTLDRFYDPIGAPVRLLWRGSVGGPTPTDRAGASNVDLADVGLLYDELMRRIRSDARLFVPAGALPARPPMIAEGALLPGDGSVNTIFEYDRLSRLTFVHKDSGAVTRLDYDGAGRTIRTTDAANDTTEWAYDAAGNAVESAEIEVSSNPGPSQEQFLTTFFYDALGRRTMTVDNLGQTSRALYDSLDALVTASDANGPAGGSIQRRAHAGMTVPVNGHGNVTRYTYDGAGRALTTVQVLTASGKGDGTTSPAPDPSNPANSDGLITSTTVWSDNGLPLRSMDDKGNSTSYLYDNLDRPVRITRPDETFSTLGYDGEGALSSHIDPNGTRVTNLLDPAGRMFRRNVEASPGLSGSRLQTFEYDGLSRLTRAVDPNQATDSTDDTNIVFIYDSLGRLIEEGQLASGPVGGASRYSDLAWQAHDLLTGLTYPDGDQVMYGYDGAGRLRTMSDMLHPELMATFEYFGMNRLHTRLSGNGVRLTYLDDSGAVDVGYDGERRPILMRHLDPSNTLLAGFEYRYDRVGNATSERRLHDGGAVGRRGNVYTHDSAGRLLSSQEAYLDANHDIVSPPLDQQSFTLDGPGNWADFARNGALYRNTPNNLNEYDDPQCCGTHVDDGVPDDFFDLASTPFADGLNLTYDRNGNQTSTIRQSLAYNFLNLPVIASDPRGNPVAAYAYDALGRRTRRVVTGGEGSIGTRTEAYAGGLFGESIEEDDAAGGLAMQYGVGPGGGCLWHVRGDGTSQYLLEDALGSTVALTPAFAAGGAGVLERVVYDPYGKPTFEDPLNNPITAPGGGPFLAESQYDNHHLFRGMHYDPELGARGTSASSDFGGLYVGGGYYNPNEGRGMSGTGGELVGRNPGPISSPDFETGLGPNTMGAHMMSYRGEHLEGPWHGGGWIPDPASPDLYFEVHMHTIAEWYLDSPINLFAPRKAYGGPIVRPEPGGRGSHPNYDWGGLYTPSGGTIGSLGSAAGFHVAPTLVALVFSFASGGLAGPIEPVFDDVIQRLQDLEHGCQPPTHWDPDKGECI